MLDKKNSNIFAAVFCIKYEIVYNFETMITTWM